MNDKVEKSWGYYAVLQHLNSTVKVKELVCNPHSKLSMQRHFKRKELWFFAEGEGYINTLNNKQEIIELGKYKPFDTVIIDYEQWHQLENRSNIPVKIIEIQYGHDCIEEDIQRKL
jgi:mannose-1-phosphate guanylyltransferase